MIKIVILLFIAGLSIFVKKGIMDYYKSAII